MYRWDYCQIRIIIHPTIKYCMIPEMVKFTLYCRKSLYPLYTRFGCLYINVQNASCRDGLGSALWVRLILRVDKIWCWARYNIRYKNKLAAMTRGFLKPYERFNKMLQKIHHLFIFLLDFYKKKKRKITLTLKMFYHCQFHTG